MAQPYVNAGTSAATVMKNSGGGIVKSTVGPDGTIKDYGFAPPPSSPGKGKSPVAKSTPTKKPAVKAVDPYANPQQYINRAVARLGLPLTDAQIQTNAQGQLSPLIQQLTDSLNRQAQSGTAAIGGYTSDLAKALGGYQQNAQNIYSGAQQSQAASDNALTAKLAGEGGQQAQDLGARLASINAPGATNAAVGAATQNAIGSGNALYATGSASLANLIASGAAEQSYAGKLPGLAGLAGEQQLGGLQHSIASSLADKTAGIEAQAPGIVSGLQTQRSDLLGKKETLRGDLNTFFSTRDNQKAALAQERAALGLPDPSLSGKVGVVVDKTGKPVPGADGKPQVLPGYHNTPSGGVAKDVKPAKAPGPAKVNTTLSKANGYLTDGSGNAILKGGKKQPYNAGGPATKPISATTLRKAGTDAEDLYHGVTKKNAQGQDVTVAYTQTYQDAIKTLMGRYPELGRQGVLDLVNRWYQPGQFGRPAVSAKTQRAVNQGVGIPKTTGPFAGITGGQ